MVKRVLALMIVIASCPLMAAVVAWVDKTDIDETEVITLTIERTGARGMTEPDWSVLSNDFSAFSPSSSSSYTINNGVVRSEASWSIRLRPLKTGILKIPSFTFGNESTTPVEITVRELDPVWRERIDKSVFFETRVNSAEQYVQAGVLVTRRLYYTFNSQVPREIPAPSDIENALVVVIGEIEDTVAVRDEVNYGVLVQRFVIYPEQSGELTIPPVSVPASLNVNGRYFSIPVTSEEVRIQILPIPDEYPADHEWFPATDVRVTDSLEDEDLSGFTAGDSFLRTIKITANGSHSSGIPDIEFPLPDGMRQYPDPPELTDTVLVAELASSRQQTSSIVLTRPGTFRIGQPKIVWWNTETKSVETVELEGRSITVKPNPLDSAQSSNSIQTEPSEQDALANQPPSDGGLQRMIVSNPLWMHAITWGGWIVAIGLVVVFWIRRNAIFSSSTKPRESHTDATKFHQLVRSEDPADVRRGMIDWVAAEFEVSRTEALATLQSNPESRDILQKLNAQLYSPNPNQAITDSKEVIRVVQKFLSNQDTKSGFLTSYLKQYDSLTAS